MYGKYLSKIDDDRDEIFGISDKIWDYAELAFDEVKSSKLLADGLEAKGFRVTRGIKDIPTCFVAEYGEGRPVLAIQAEYDALDGMSQRALMTEAAPIPGKTTGHGCGHNLFAAGSYAAAIAVKEFIDEKGCGTLRFYGCPAEESGAGKVFMVREGLYKEVDAVVSWHPTTFSMVRTRLSLANVMVEYSFKGIPSHAGGSPEKGRSALDAAELMNVGANFLREHMDLTSRIHYAFTDAGGTAPNVVQAAATVRYLIRALDSASVRELKRRVDLLADGAATMTETTYTQKVISAYSNLITVSSLQKIADEAGRDVPYPLPTEEDICFANELRKTMNLSEKELSEEPFERSLRRMAPPANHGGSTDTADVSWNAPTVQFHIGTWCQGTPGHSWQAVSQGKCRYAKEMELYAGKCIAGTVMRLYDSPEALKEIRDEWFSKTKGEYVCPLPEDLRPLSAGKTENEPDDNKK